MTRNPHRPSLMVVRSRGGTMKERSSTAPPVLITGIVVLVVAMLP